MAPNLFRIVKIPGYCTAIPGECWEELRTVPGTDGMPMTQSQQRLKKRTVVNSFSASCIGGFGTDKLIQNILNIKCYLNFRAFQNQQLLLVKINGRNIGYIQIVTAPCHMLSTKSEQEFKCLIKTHTKKILLLQSGGAVKMSSD